MSVQPPFLPKAQLLFQLMQPRAQSFLVGVEPAPVPARVWWPSRLLRPRSSATFASSPPPPSALSVTVTGAGKGSVTGGVSCSSGTCSGTFPQGSSVTLSAAPNSGSTFAGWGGACTGTGSCVVAPLDFFGLGQRDLCGQSTTSKCLERDLNGRWQWERNE